MFSYFERDLLARAVEMASSVAYHAAPAIQGSSYILHTTLGHSLSDTL